MPIYQYIILPDSVDLAKFMTENNRSLRLLADSMLGRLAKWLRFLGYDTAYERDAADHELARRARAEGRVLLTRDHDLAVRRGLDILLIESEQFEEQVEEVQAALGGPPAPAFSRCSICNVVLEDASPSEIADRVPPYVLEHQKEFRCCPACGRVYWSGSHVQAMNHLLEQFDAAGDDVPATEGRRID